jgi:5-methylcytosine-specific restriction protein B
MELNQALIARVVDVAKKQPNQTGLTGDDDCYQRFLDKFPKESLKNISLTDYCIGKGSDPENFCWWIEWGLQKALARYSAGSARGHLLYLMQDGSYYKTRQFKEWEDDDVMAYVAKLTHAIANCQSPEEALKLDDANSLCALAGVDHITTPGPARILHILGIYNPDWVLPVNSPRHIRHYLLEFGYEKEDVPKNPVASLLELTKLYNEINAQLATKLTPYAFMRVLYSEDLSIRPKTRAVEQATEVIHDSVDESIPLNQILYGPPGTGKTYHTVNKALSIIDPAYLKAHKESRNMLKARFDNLQKEGRIGFVTFHQSFSYEDFVEGIKTFTNDDDQIYYDIEDGIFKEMCLKASVSEKSHSKEDVDLTGKRIWKMSLGNTLEDDGAVYDECIEKGYALLGWGESFDFTGCVSREDIADKYSSTGKDISEKKYGISAIYNFIHTIKQGDIVIISDGNKKFRAIGEFTGDYHFLSDSSREGFRQSRPVIWHKTFTPSKPISDLFKKSLSQMTLYELRDSTIDRDLLSKMLKASVSGDNDLISVGEKFKNYHVSKVSNEIIEFIKPNGGVLPFPRIIIDELFKLVRQKKITIDDIKEKKVFDKLPDTKLEKFFVNGYENLLHKVVKHLVDGSPKGGSPTNEIKPFVLIVDEINRGNIAKILGELITLVEPSKRRGNAEQLTVKLPYSKEPFSVPNNLYLIGTMNTADRSLAQIDIALRRRFVFEELLPDHLLLKSIGKINGVDVMSMVEAINSRIELLYDRDHTLGHSIFLSLKDDPSLGALANIFEQQVLPLLEEYFFEDWEKISQVLGDHLKPKEYAFVREKYTAQQVANLMGNEWSSEDVVVYERHAEALDMPESYIGIYDAPSLKVSEPV